MMRYKFFALLLFPICMLAACSSSSTKYSDDEMIKSFQQNKAVFQELLSMFQEDTTTSIINPDKEDKSDFLNNVNPDRMKNYKKLLDQLGLNRIQRDVEDGVNEISFYHIVDKQTRKGYLYTENKVDYIDTNIDDYIKKSKLDAPVFIYRKIEGNWYIYYHKEKEQMNF